MENTLRTRIGWLCQFIRFAALTYAAWVIYSVITLWLDKSEVVKRYGNWLKVDLTGISDGQRVMGFLLHAIICILVAAACYSAWRLSTNYLAGKIFTLESSILLRRVGNIGLIAELADIAFRPLVTYVVSSHLPTGHRMVGLSINQPDLAFLMFLTTLIALGHIFTKAAEIAADNESFV